MLVTTDRLHPSVAWSTEEIRPVLPGEVADTIREALARGWEPDVDGTPFRLDLSSGAAVRG
ncbi:hypothetical protein AB0L82_37910 [Nocardia sp. NPDC052001]|uniref:hypothetical protein n=1 Tax=Nocardia sp. NPDC052001 TaxID=3154853 RepID=UPI0034256919